MDAAINALLRARLLPVGSSSRRLSQVKANACAVVSRCPAHREATRIESPVTLVIKFANVDLGCRRLGTSLNRTGRPSSQCRRERVGRRQS